MPSTKKIILLTVIIIGIPGIIYLLFKPVHKAEEIVFSKDYPDLEKTGTVNIVTEYNNPGYFVSGDSVSGFNYDFLQAISQYTALEFNIYVENNIEKCIKGLQSGEYDIIVRNLPVNTSLKEELLFTEPINYNKLILVQKKEEDAIKSHLKLANKTIYLPKSSPVKLRLENLSYEIGDSIFIVEDSLYDSPQLIMKVAAGEIEYTVADEKTAQELAKINCEIDISTAIGFTHIEAWAVRKDSPILLDSLNSWIKRFKGTKESENLYKKYYN